MGLQDRDYYWEKYDRLVNHDSPSHPTRSALLKAILPSQPRQRRASCDGSFAIAAIWIAIAGLLYGLFKFLEY